MNFFLIHQCYAALAPWTVVSLLLLGRNPRLARTRIIVSLLLAIFLLLTPVYGWSVFAWIRVLEPNPSFTLTGLLVLALWRRISGRRFFCPAEWRTAWMFGSGTALILYPMGLGLTSMDPYCWGWGSILPVAVTLTATVLLLKGNRFGVILLFPMAGYLLHLQHSRNFWDSLTDPFYAGFSLIAVAVLLLRRRPEL